MRGITYNLLLLSLCIYIEISYSLVERSKRVLPNQRSSEESDNTTATASSHDETTESQTVSGEETTTTETPPTSETTTETSSTSNTTDETTTTLPSNATTTIETTTQLPSTSTTMVPVTNGTNTSSEVVLTNPDEILSRSRANKWDIRGTWTKNIPSKFENLNPIADMNVTSWTTILFLTRDLKHSELLKKFPVFENGTIEIVQYTNCSRNASITGEISHVIYEKSVDRKTLFNISGDTLANLSSKWFVATYDIPMQKDLSLIELKIRSNVDENCIWIVSGITVAGHMVEGNNTGTTTEPPTEGLVTEMSKIASAIWDAFFALLALFCACLVALVILTCRNRRRDDVSINQPAPRYNSRSSTFQLEKNQARDNNAFQMENI